MTNSSYFLLTTLLKNYCKEIKAHRQQVYRRFHGRGRHLGSGANAAKFTVNVWEKS